MPLYRREDRAMPLYISMRIEFYNGIAIAENHSTRPLKATMIVNNVIILQRQEMLQQLSTGHDYVH